MLKIAIIEDEPMILRNIALFAQRLDPEFSRVSKFLCGADFLEYIADELPDIVISDIRLPDMLGTDLLKRCKQINSNIKFVIISAYKNFEYAQSAIEYKADAYLTKPVEHSVLSQTLLNLKEELSKNISYHYNRSVNELLRIILSKCEKNVFKSQAELKLELEQYNILNIISNHFFTVCVSADNIASISAKHSCDSDYVMTSLSNFILMPDFNANGICVYKSVSIANMLKLYISVPLSQESKPFSTAVNLLKLINDSCLEYLGFSLKHSIICEYGNIYDFLGKKAVFYTDLTLSEFELFVDFNISSMVLYYSENEETEYLHCVDSICAFLAAAKTEKSVYYKQYCSLLSEKIFNGFKTLAPFAEEPEFNDSFLSSFKAICQKIFDRHYKNQNGNSLLAEKTMQYIKDNLASQTLTLSEISNSCYTHPVYLSRIFKQTYDLTIHQCITSLRIAKAKEMLRQGASLDDVSYSCGYKTVKYFSKIFKQVTGESPTKYKKRWNI